jgi:hypothetical protein
MAEATWYYDISDDMAAILHDGGDIAAIHLRQQR